MEEQEFRCGFVALAGRPSAGKSTLLNAICGQKVAITSPKPQTTREVIRGIVHRPSHQLVFLDTPGFTEAGDATAKKLRGALYSALGKAEVVLYLLDLSRPPKAQSTQNNGGNRLEPPAPPLEERGLLAMLQQALKREPRPLCIALNKSDLLANPKEQQQRREQYLALVREYFPRLEESRCFAISAKQQDGLEALLDFLGSQVPQTVPLYEPSVFSDQNPRFRVQELIREQALPFCGRELPYAMRVQVADMEPRSFVPRNPKEQHESGMWVRAFLQVERDSQKGILVGKAGKRIREIRLRSTKVLRRELNCPVLLDLQVKVAYKWRRN